MLKKLLKLRGIYQSLNLINEYIVNIAAILIESFSAFRFLIFRNKLMIHCNIKKMIHYKKHNVAIVVGNGPSLAAVDISTFENKDIFTANFFANYKHAKKLKSTVHAAADRYFNGCSIDEIIKHDSKMYILHYSMMDVMKEKKNTPLYFQPSFITIDRWCFNFLKGVCPIPAPKNTTQLLLLIAIIMDYKKIYLVGVDEDQMKNPKSHFNSHFYENYGPYVERIKERSYTDRLQSKYETMRGYQKIRILAEKKSIKIINLNRSSFLDAFDFQE